MNTTLLIFMPFMAMKLLYSVLKPDSDFPPKKAIIVTAWTILRHEDLLKNWNRLANGKQITKIKPLV